MALAACRPAGLPVRFARKPATSSGLTTFSSFSAEVVFLLQQARYALAFGTAMLHVGGSLLLTIAGYHTATLLLPGVMR